jgi:hypothetical protein
MHPNQVVAPGNPPGRRRRGGLIAAIIGAIATVIGIISGAIAIADYLGRDKGPAVFSESVDTASGMRNFLSFADKNDGKVVKLDMRCVYHDGPRTCVDQEDFLHQAAVLLDLNADTSCEPDRQAPCDGSVVLFFFEQSSSEAQIDNGEFGAGSIVVRGYFTLSKRGNLGTLPPGVTAIYLTAVPAEKAPKAG